MHLNRRTTKFWILALVTLGQSCGGDEAGPSAVAPDPPRATTITVTPATAQLYPSQSVTYSAEVRDQNGRIMAGASVTWTVVNSAVATHSSGGQVTATAVGTTQVRAASGALAGTATLTVEQWPVTEIVLDVDSLRLTTVGASAQLVAAPRDAAGQDLAAPIEWSIEEEEVATISDSGLVLAVADGSTSVTISAGDVSVTLPVTVHFVAVSLEIPTDSVNFDALGDSLELQAIVRDSLGSLIPSTVLDWTTRDAAVVVVSTGGVLGPVGPGATQILVTSGDLSDSVTVVVAPVPTTLSLSVETLTLNFLGALAEVSALVRDRTEVELTYARPQWSSSDETVAVVAADSTLASITAVATGSAVVSVQLGELASEVVVTVRQVPAALSLAPSQLTLFGFGAQDTIVATVTDSAAVVVPEPALAWSSGDVTVVTVDGAGIVTSQGLGQTEVTATIGDLVESVAMTVVERAAATTLAAPATVAPAGRFTLALDLDMTGRSVAAGAVAVQISFDPALVKFDSNSQTTITGMGAWFWNNAAGWYRLVISQPAGLTPGTIATLPFQALGASGSTIIFTMNVLQAITADTYEDITAQVIPVGAETRIQ